LNGLSITYILSISFMTRFTVYVFPSKSGWQVVLKCRIFLNPLNNPFKTFDVNFGCLLDTIVLAIPCNQAIYFRFISTMLDSLRVIFTGIKWVALVSLSTTTMIESCYFLVLGSLLIKSIVTTSHFHSGMGNGCSKLVGCLCSILNFWHAKHLEIKSTTSFFMLDQ
jgi:hypothetical protein